MTSPSTRLMCFSFSTKMFQSLVISLLMPHPLIPSKSQVHFISGGLDPYKEIIQIFKSPPNNPAPFLDHQ